MDDRSMPPKGGDKPPEIADAEALFRDDHPETVRRHEAVPGSAGPDVGGGYELDEPVESEGPSPASTVPETRPTPGRRRRPESPSPATATADPADLVSEVWTRTAEWGGTILQLVGAGVMLVLVLYLLVSLEEFGVAFVALLLGGIGLAVLSYPIVITLERPVRVTPEQAVRDYYASLSHHIPHYRRMWLLLSNQGRSAGGFATFEGYRNYWKNRLIELKGGQASSITPLKFTVSDFKSEKSAGKTAIGVTFRIDVTIRGQQDRGVVHAIPVKTTLVKGPDKMWYLDRGMLP